MTIAEMETCTPRDRRGVFKFLARDTEDEKEIVFAENLTANRT